MSARKSIFIHTPRGGFAPLTVSRNSRGEILIKQGTSFIVVDALRWSQLKQAGDKAAHPLFNESDD